MKFLIGLIFGIILGAGGLWFFATHDNRPVGATTPAHSATPSLSDSFKAKMDALDLRTDEIKDELTRTGKVIRHKAYDVGEQVADAAADAKVVAAIKAKYAVDPDVSVWKISVSATQGHVTLSGTVSAPEDVGKAMALAMDVDGVRDVISTIQVK